MKIKESGSRKKTKNPSFERLEAKQIRERFKLAPLHLFFRYQRDIRHGSAGTKKEGRLETEVGGTPGLNQSHR